MSKITSKKATKLLVDAIRQLRENAGFTAKEIMGVIDANLEEGMSKTTARCVLTALKRGEQYGFLRANRGRFVLKVSPNVLCLNKQGEDDDDCFQFLRRKRRMSRCGSRKGRSSRRRSRSASRRRSHRACRRKSRSSRRRKARSSSRGKSHCRGKHSSRSRRRRSRSASRRRRRSASKRRHSCKSMKRRTTRQRRYRSVSRRRHCVAKPQKRRSRKSSSQSGGKRQTRSKKLRRKANCRC